MNPMPIAIPKEGIIVIDSELLEVFKKRMDGWTDRMCVRADELLQSSGFDPCADAQTPHHNIL